MQLSQSKKQVVYLYFCTFVGMGIGILVSILNTRFLAPESYGDVRYVNNIISFFSGIFLVGYFVSGSRLLALAKNREEAKQLKGGLIFILLILSLCMMIVMIGCGLYHYHTGESFYPLFFWAIPVSSSALLLSYINTSCQGDNSIGTIGLARLLPSACYLVVGYLIYSRFGATSWRMILLQNGIAVFILAFLLKKNEFSFTNLRETLSRLREENKKYGRQVYYGSLANVSVQYVAGISLGLFGADNVNVGFYSLALTISAPLQMLPSIVGTTFFKKFAVQNQIMRKVLISTTTISAISLLGFLLLIFPAVDILYNDNYSKVAIYASFLALGATFHGLGDVFNRFLGAHGKGTMLRNGAFVCGAIALIGYTWGIKIWGINGAIITRILSSCAYFTMMLLYYILFLRSEKDNGKK